MAKFKVGDRVRVIAHEGYTAENSCVIGHEGVIVGKVGNFFATQMVDVFAPGMTLWHFYAWELAPLTPPAQDEWADAKVKQVTRPTYLEPVRTKERDFYTNGSGA